MKTLTAEIDINIRFSETDAMGVVWHGNYVKFLEVAREAFGEKFGLSYLGMYKQGYFTPIVKVDVDYKSPIFYGEKAKVIINYIPTPAAKIIFEYEVFNVSTGKLSAVGKTIQIFLNSTTRALELNKPEFHHVWELNNNIKLK